MCAGENGSDGVWCQGKKDSFIVVHERSATRYPINGGWVTEILGNVLDVVEGGQLIVGADA